MENKKSVDNFIYHKRFYQICNFFLQKCKKSAVVISYYYSKYSFVSNCVKSVFYVPGYLKETSVQLFIQVFGVKSFHLKRGY